VCLQWYFAGLIAVPDGKARSARRRDRLGYVGRIAAGEMEEGAPPCSRSSPIGLMRPSASATALPGSDGQVRATPERVDFHEFWAEIQTETRIAYLLQCSR
jgi:hypothetical protein